MLSEKRFDEITEKSKKYKYSSMNYIYYDDCQNADILCEQDGLILFKEKSSPIIHFAANEGNCR